MYGIEMYPKFEAVFCVTSNNTWGTLCCKISRKDGCALGVTESSLAEGDKLFAVLSKCKYTNETGLFITVQVVNEHPQVNQKIKKQLNTNQKQTIFLYVSETFMNHYRILETDTVYIRKAKCLPLKSVVFGAKTDAAYEWMQSRGWREKLVQSLVDQPILCRREDILLVDPVIFPDVEPTLLLDITTIDCSPVSQGLLCLETSILVLRVSWQSPSTRDVISPSMQFMLNLVNQVKFTGRLLMPVPGNNGEIQDRTGIINSAILRAVTKKFKVTISRKPIKDSRRHDVHSTVFLGHQVLKSLNIREGSWARVSLSHQRLERDSWCSDPTDVNSGTSTPVKRAARQMSIPNEEDALMKSEESLVRIYSHKELDQPALVTPLFWFNINVQPSTLEQPDRHIILQQVMVEAPPYATEAYICLVQTPFYEVTVSCDSLLKQYFTIPRCLRKGDIIALPTSGHAEAHNQNWKDCLVCPVIYFQVSSFIGPPSTHYLVDSSVSRLYQSGSNQSYLPVTMETYGSPWPMHPIWHSPKPPGLEVYVDKLCQLITPFLHNREFRGQVSSCVLIRGQSGAGKSLVVKAVSRCLNIQTFSVESQDLVGESTAATEARFKQVATKAFTYAPCILLLKDICSVSKEKEANGEDPRIVHSLCEMLRSLSSSSRSYPVVTVATSTMELNADLQGVFLHQINMDPPDQSQREIILNALLSPMQTSMDISLEYFAQRTASMVLGDLSMMVSLASQAAFTRFKKEVDMDKLSPDDELVAIGLSGVPIIHADMALALELMHQSQAEAIGAPQIPSVFWEDIGGLEEARKELLDTVQLPLLYPNLTQAGLRRSGVLLYGPPGTGKTLLAKAVATECSLSFLSVKGPELINRYVGQSEENIREVFQRARSAAPCIIFFDELDSLGPNRGRSGDSGGVMDRVVSQLLAELDGLQKSNQVFVIGATNRPDLLDPALLRPGRFDRLVQVGIADTTEGRLEILKALTRKFHLNPDVNLAEVESLCPKSMSGADFYGMCASANMASLGRCIHLIEEGKLTESEARPEVAMEDFLSALRTIRTEKSLDKGSTSQETAKIIEKKVS